MYFSLKKFPAPRLTIATVGVLLGLFAGTASASSGSGSGTATSSCSYPDAEQVFSSFGDNGYYQLAPDGGLETGGTGWTFSGGARIVEGNEDRFLNSAEDQAALSLPYGATATSPKVCVDQSTPSFRLMTLNGGDDHVKLRVTVTYELPRETKTRVVEFRADDAWAPTEQLQLDIDGETERVARISFTPRERGGDWLVDDLFIDPFARH